MLTESTEEKFFNMIWPFHVFKRATVLDYLFSEEIHKSNTMAKYILAPFY
jgi:hypothetical protein